MDRRKFLKRLVKVGLGAAVVGGGYTLLEAKWCRVARVRLAVRNLPRAFEGTTVSFLSDIHSGPYVPRSYIRHVVEMSNALKPDIVALGGDYVHHGARYIEPGIDELAKLRAGMGRFSVLGNHDHWDGPALTWAAFDAAGITSIDNAGVWVEWKGARLRIGGVGDLWEDRQDLNAALGDATEDDAAIVLSHNPDTVETLTDRRVGLVLSGHTHGGQIIVPGFGAPIVPSKYGQKYVHGLVQGPVAPVFVSRGVGTVTPPVRFACRPELVFITLAAQV